MLLCEVWLADGSGPVLGGAAEEAALYALAVPETRTFL